MPELPPLNVPQLLHNAGLRPTKSLGQNFLISESALHKVVQAADLRGDETVLEIGAGLGSLTRHLGLAAKRVVAVELDQRLIPILNTVVAGQDNLTLVRGDILEIDLVTLSLPADYFVIANIPYYLTSNLIRRLLEAQRQPRRLVLTIQREVAERVCAAPGELSLLALSVQVYGTPQITAIIPPGAFYPPPRIASAILRVDVHPSPVFPPANLETFFRLARAGFSQKRKNLRNALSGGLRQSKDVVGAWLANASIDPNRRAESLSLEEWQQLVDQHPPLSGSED